MKRWEEETTYIIGGGPSAARHDLRKLDGIIIAVNDSARELPDSDIVFTASPPWVRHRLPLIQGFRGLVVFQNELSALALGRLALPAHVQLVPLRRMPGISEEEHRLGHNSGQEALHWAADQGARRIVLVGFDLTTPANWHGVYEWQPDKNDDPTFDYQRWAHNFATSALEMQQRGVQVFNANDQSAIRCFPYTDLPVPRRRVSDPTCAVIIPVGPGHEGFSESAERSVLRAWEHDPGPFAAMTVTRIWDADGKLGPSGARNKGLDENPADWHFLLDADDEMMVDAFRHVELDAPATFGAVLLDSRLAAENRWPVTWDTIRQHGASGTLSMGCFIGGDLGLRFRMGMFLGEDFDFYMRLPGFRKVREPLVNIGYRKPRAGGGTDREAVGWLHACRAVIDNYLDPPANAKPHGANL